MDPAIRLQLLRAAAVLGQGPFPSAGSRIQPMVGIVPRHFRLRIGEYRLIYRVEGEKVVVVRVAHRREAYR
ncbi:MAG: type II toxin-antitoxin system RelE/ParE family toxin [Candidatus Omnitrophica bacterium]|nr:type II toxin-antitoxin system RelE/ParE family toxin [Candidatus Omnitrophota bacterium]